MTKIIVVLFSIIIILNIVTTEEESPVAISNSADKEERTGVQEELNTVGLTISIEEVTEGGEQLSKSGTENDGNRRRSTDSETSRAVDDVQVGESPEEKQGEVSESKEGIDIEVQERSEIPTDNDEASRTERAEEVERVHADTYESNTEDVSRLHEEDSKPETFNLGLNDANLESGSEERTVAQDVMLDTKGRMGHSSQSWEVVKAVSPEDFRTFDSPVPLDSAIFRRKQNNVLIPNYHKAISRNAYPYNVPPNMYRFPPYFGRLTNPEPIQDKQNEKSIPENIRRASNVDSSEIDITSRVLEDYTDPDSNAYPYTPSVENRTPVPRNAPSPIALHQKLLDATNQQAISQLNPFNTDLRPMYASNYPYVFSTRLLNG